MRNPFRHSPLQFVQIQVLQIGFHSFEIHLTFLSVFAAVRARPHAGLSSRKGQTADQSGRRKRKTVISNPLTERRDKDTQKKRGNVPHPPGRYSTTGCPAGRVVRPAGGRRRSPGNARRTFPGSGETRKTHPRYIFPPLRTHFGRLFATFIYFFVPQKVNFCDESCILSYICIRFPNLNRTFAQ